MNKLPEKIIWRGQETPIIYDRHRRAAMDATGIHLCAPTQELPDPAIALEMLLKRCAKAYLVPRTLELADEMGIESPASIKVNGAVTRWGSCSSKRTLNFSWRLCCAKDAVSDAVIVHELAHLRVMNHSADFYAVVRGFLPDYDQRHAQLRILSQYLRDLF